MSAPSPAQGHRLPNRREGALQRLLRGGAQGVVWGAAALVLLVCVLLLAVSFVAALATM